MTKNEKTSGAPSKRSRRSTEHLTKRRTIRFSVEEESAVAEVREALAIVRGCGVEDVSFSEALRLLLLDKEGAAEIEARAKVVREAWLGNRKVNRTFEEDLSNVSQSLGAVELQLRRIGVNLNQIARRINSGDRVSRAEIAEALASFSTIAVQIELAEMSMHENFTLIA